MVFRRRGAEAGLSPPASIVCLHSIHSHPSEEKVGESHRHNSHPKGMVQFRLHAG